MAEEFACGHVTREEAVSPNPRAVEFLCRNSTAHCWSGGFAFSSGVFEFFPISHIQ